MDRIYTDLPLSPPSLLKIRDYWVTLRGSRKMPSRPEFNPAAIVRYLPYLTLVDVVENPLRFRYRLIGTRITDLAGRDSTGKWLNEELYGDKTEDILWAYTKCVTEKTPIAVRELVQFVDKTWVTIDVALFPFGDEKGNIDIVLGAVDFTAEDAELPGPKRSYILNWEAKHDTGPGELS
ncbi:PAS domain-containing protein [uncultured Sneathiella sp.]|uniref:PAS domain-containing protein n=1 Tax=uncultured Sneathiella sp. TaxID=879315 RepID=UPI0030DBF3C7|tara:strand:+ start:100 stop:636 length:537 start_codon:yes stop_codon:yes gene_type:complete